MNIPMETRINVDVRDLIITIDELRNKAQKKRSEASVKQVEVENLYAEARGLTEGADALQSRLEKLVSVELQVKSSN